MAEITAALVKELREKTGAGMMDCKKALGETAGRPRGGGRLAAHEGPGGGRQEGRPHRGRRPGRRRRQRQPRAPSSRSTPRPTSSPATRRSRSSSASAASSRSTPAATSTKIAAAPFPGTGRDVQGELTNLIATIGENMSLRRAALAVGVRRRRRRLRAQRGGAGPRQDRRAGGARIDRRQGQARGARPSSSPCMSRRPTRSR